MRTDDLIDQLAADNSRRRASPDSALSAAIIGGALFAGIAFWFTLGVRPDFANALMTWRFDFKFVVTLAIAASAAALLRGALYPTARFDPLPLLIGPALIAIAVAIELVASPADAWSMAATGKNGIKCLTIVPALGIVPLALLIVALRHGAPARPGWAGFLEGVLSGGLAATYYAANCTDDSPLFVMTWYPLAILGLGGVGALLGRVLARW